MSRLADLIPRGNVRKIVRHLRALGVEVTPAQEQAWLAQEDAYRQGRRIVLRAVRYGCSHCGRRWEVVVQRWSAFRKCPDCGRQPTMLCELWFQRGDGTRTEVTPHTIVGGDAAVDLLGDP